MRPPMHLYWDVLNFKRRARQMVKDTIYNFSTPEPKRIVTICGNGNIGRVAVVGWLESFFISCPYSYGFSLDLWKQCRTALSHTNCLYSGIWCTMEPHAWLLSPANPNLSIYGAICPCRGLVACVCRHSISAHS